MHSILKELQLTDQNPGVYWGEQGWHSPANQWTTSVNPATGKTIAKVAAGSQQDYDALMQRALAAAESWAKVPAPKRGELVRRIGEKLRQHKMALGSLVSLEMGKIKAEGEGEVQEMIDMADFAVGQSRMLYGLSMHSERPQHRMYEQWHPMGVVGVITAFNFPVAVWAWNAFIAAICGNVTVWKPSPKTALCAVAVQHICNQVTQELGYPDVFYLFNTSDTTLVEHLVDDSRMPLISFTGSSVVGKKLAARVAQRAGKSLLELSGNNAVIVDETADWSLALRAIVFGAVGTAGQRCTSTRRLLIHASRIDECIQALAKAYRQIPIGDPLDAKTLVGPLVDAMAVEHYQKAIAEVQALGGEIVCGGKVIDQPGFFVEPTLVIGAKPDWPCVQRETFAPILYVMPFKNIEEAIAINNQVVQGLSSSLFTLNLRHAEQFLSAQGSDCGIANINIGTSGAEIGGAFGGEKDTGGGREAGSDAWKAYMRRQTNTINWGKELPLAQGISFDIG